VKINQTHVTQNLAKTEENVVIMGKLIPVNVLMDTVEDIVLLKHITHVLQDLAKIEESVLLKVPNMCVHVQKDIVADIVPLNHHHPTTMMTSIKLT